MSATNDFDFLHGRWQVAHRRLGARGVGSGDWSEFDGTAETRPLLGGLCNIEEHRMAEPGLSGIALRSFDRSTSLWSIHWISSCDGILQPPVIGRFEDGVGRFEGEDVDDERRVQVRVRYQWEPLEPGSARWEQSFSYDGGRTWELNWIMRFRREP